jgi:hypothetical protein
MLNAAFDLRLNAASSQAIREADSRAGNGVVATRRCFLGVGRKIFVGG